MVSMEDLMRELDVNELEKFAGGKKSKASKAKDAAYCTYWWGLCATAASDTYGCGSTQANCEYFKKYC